MIYQNFYIKAPVEMLETPLPLTDFIKPDTDPVEYYTITEYLATFNHTVERFTTDGKYFLKGFGFNLAGIDDLRANLAAFNLEIGTNIWVLSPGELQDELNKPEWIKEEII